MRKQFHRNRYGRGYRWVPVVGHIFKSAEEGGREINHFAIKKPCVGCVGFWRHMRMFGDCIFHISKTLYQSPEKLHFYIDDPRRGVSLAEDWSFAPSFLDLLRITKGGERFVLHKPGESPNEDYFIVNSYRQRSITKLFSEDRQLTYAKVDFNKVKYNKLLDHIDFKKTICWSARLGLAGTRLSLETPPKCLRQKYPNFNFINVGETEPTETQGKTHAFDTDTTAWIIKKSFKYVGVDSGGTHFALMIKEPKDILLYGLSGSREEEHIINQGVTCFNKNGEGL